MLTYPESKPTSPLDDGHGLHSHRSKRMLWLLLNSLISQWQLSNQNIQQDDSHTQHESKDQKSSKNTDKEVYNICVRVSDSRNGWKKLESWSMNFLP